MNRGRLRIATALTALLTLLALQTEAAWASRCAPPAPETSQLADCDQAAASHERMPGTRKPDQHSKAPPDCPLLAVTGGTCMPASLPAVGAGPFLLAGSGDTVWPQEPAVSPLLPSGPFRPPRA
jgi:hypothetical protein